MAEMLWAAAGLLLMLPADMKPVAVENERIAVLGLQPPVLGHTDQLVCSWSDGKGTHIALHWWNASQSPRDYGPLSTVEDWEASIDNRRVFVARTEIFMGPKEEVLVAWPPLAEHKASAMLHASGVSRESFDSMLKGSRIIESGQSWNMTCEPARGDLQ
jgi:hypothetical protein